MGNTEYEQIKVNTVKGRYVTTKHLQNFLSTLPNSFKIEVVGLSVQKNSIQSITFGEGSKRVLMWSQMHGNESTTTKAVLDFINFMQLQKSTAKVLEECTFKIIPILNPDGAKAYTRVNANGVDLNRDAQDLSQPESKLLRKTYEEFKPHFCFNLHDQRTIFNVGDTKKPATISFLAPAFDNDRSISKARAASMLLIAAMNKVLQTVIQGQVGRYDDGFNANCVGDAFQMLQTPTILFEAGHFPNDYEREETRKYIYYALEAAVNAIALDTFKSFTIADYADIPDNNKLFCDVLIKNADSIKTTLPKEDNIYVLYKEVLKEEKILFEPRLLSGQETDTVRFGHEVKDCKIPSDVTWLKDQGLLELIQKGY